jgi:hypothetical protein
MAILRPSGIAKRMRIPNNGSVVTVIGLQQVANDVNDDMVMISV